MGQYVLLKVLRNLSGCLVGYWYMGGQGLLLCHQSPGWGVVPCSGKVTQLVAQGWRIAVTVADVTKQLQRGVLSDFFSRGLWAATTN